MRGAESELAPVSYPLLTAAVEARAVLEAGVTWLRLSRGPVSRSTAEALYDRLQAMLAQLGDGGRFVDRDAFLAANESFHAAVIDLAENEYLSQAFRRLRLRELFAIALKETPATPEGVVSLHENLTDSIAAGDAIGAVRAVRRGARPTRQYPRIFGEEAHRQRRPVVPPAGIIETCRCTGQRAVQPAGDVDAW